MAQQETYKINVESNAAEVTREVDEAVKDLKQSVDSVNSSASSSLDNVSKSADKAADNIGKSASGMRELADESVDVILLYDTFHSLANPNGVLRELYRVLRPNGILSFSDHHMGGDEIASKGTNAGLFRFLRKDKRTYTFMKG